MNKKELFKRIKIQLAEKRNELEADLNSLVEERNNETKSSAGDKFETSRAMAQQEIDKLSNQIHLTNKQLEVIEALSTDKSKKVEMGSLVQTNTFSYLISVAVGKLQMETGIVLAISPASPIGKLLMGKEAGESFAFNGKQHQILSVQ